MTDDRQPLAPAQAALAALGILLDRTALSTPDELPATVAEAGRELGWTVVCYLVDYEQRSLVPLTPPGTAPREPLGIDGTLPGRAFRLVETVPVESQPGRLWVPLLDGVERLGVLDVTMATGADVQDEQLRRTLRQMSSLIGHLVTVVTPYSDWIDRARLSRARTVASELLWQLLPPLTYACHDVVISGLLEPAYTVAGDAFDYSVDGGTAHLAVLDAAGHDLRSGVLASVVLAAYRASRREQMTLEDTVRSVDKLLAAHTRHEGYVTGVMAQLTTRTGCLRYVNAGHPRPLLMRDGRIVKELDTAHRPLLGLDTSDLSVGEERLQPGDCVFFYTDGVTEARDEQNSFFGLDRLVGALERCGSNRQAAPESLRCAIATVLDHQKGVLQDDATLLVVEWGPGVGLRLVPT